MKVLDEHTISSAACEVMPLYDITEAYLFGSYARKEADENSDVVSFFVWGDSCALFALGGLGVALEEALGRSVDVVCGSDSFYPRARQRYLKDRKLLYAKS